MEWLNYHHLLYFWHVAREGGLTPAGRVLLTSRATVQLNAAVVSSDVAEFERALHAGLHRRVPAGHGLIQLDHGDSDAEIEFLPVTPQAEGSRGMLIPV